MLLRHAPLSRNLSRSPSSRTHADAEREGIAGKASSRHGLRKLLRGKGSSAEIHAHSLAALGRR
eukprot:5368494-Alexandrium_andersonii.AAC.1